VESMALLLPDLNKEKKAKINKWQKIQN
jgi:hypothetical protein